MKRRPGQRSRARESDAPMVDDVDVGVSASLAHALARRPTEPSLDGLSLAGLVLVTDCGRHAFRRWARLGAVAARECLQCRREAEGLTTGEGRAARRHDLCARAASRAQDHGRMT